AASLLNGIGRLRAVTIGNVTEGVVVVTASLIAVRLWGVDGVAFVMACAGIANATFLLLIAIPVGTGGRVAAPIASIGRLAVSLVVASILAGGLHTALAGAHPVLRLLVGASPTAGAF